MSQDLLNTLLLLLEKHAALLLGVTLGSVAFVSMIVGSIAYFWCRSALARQALLHEAQRSSLSQELARVTAQYDELSESMEQLDNAHRLLLSQEKKLAIEVVELRSAADAKEGLYQAEIARLTELKQGVVKEFELLVRNQMAFQQNAFVDASEKKLGGMLNPLHKQLGEFRLRMDEIHRAEVAQTHGLLGQIEQLQKQSRKIGEEATNLASALKGSNKLQGNWGEWVLRRLLEDAGMSEGREFDVQVSFNVAGVGRQQPDVVVNLPHGRHLIIDSKVSLVAYEALYRDSSSEDVLRKDLLSSMRKHVDDLSKKRYDQIVDLESLDFVIMFVPIEAAFYCALQEQPHFLSDAFAKNVVLAGPTTLMAILRCVEAMWQRDRQDKNVRTIVQEAGKLHDQFVLFLDVFEESGAALKRAQNAYDTALSRLSSGKGNLVRRAKLLQELGAKTQKAIPKSYVELSESE